MLAKGRVNKHNKVFKLKNWVLDVEENHPFNKAQSILSEMKTYR